MRSEIERSTTPNAVHPIYDRLQPSVSCVAQVSFAPLAIEAVKGMGAGFGQLQSGKSSGKSGVHPAGQHGRMSLP